MKIAICDDEIIEIKDTKKKLEHVYDNLDLLIDCYTDCRQFLKKNASVVYDLVILDIEMPQMLGIEVAELIRAAENDTAIVFLTSHLEYALKGYEVNALRYLTKPVDEKQLSEIINYLIEQKSKEKKIILKDEEDLMMVAVKDIIYFEAQNQDIKIITLKKEYTRRYNLRDYEEELSEYGFIRCHRSYLVNLEHVSRISGKEMIMDNDHKIPLSRMKEKKVRQALFSFVEKSAI
ncbi:two component transcriptional regulator, LytTR family [Lachnospiraceae bacterium KH1T2]|nr:two component transcriptional regulator, LytTR family [Lachnospiraceae bacterium KH1T2]